MTFRFQVVPSEMLLCIPDMMDFYGTVFVYFSVRPKIYSTGFFHSRFICTTMGLGEIFVKTPFLKGNTLIRKTEKYIMFMNISFVRYLNGRLFKMTMLHYFTLQVICSISEACSFAPAVFMTTFGNI